MMLVRTVLISLCAAVALQAAPTNPDSLLAEALKPPPATRLDSYTRIWPLDWNGQISRHV
jgi:hypothetical protein